MLCFLQKSTVSFIVSLVSPGEPTMNEGSRYPMTLFISSAAILIFSGVCPLLSIFLRIVGLAVSIPKQTWRIPALKPSSIMWVRFCFFALITSSAIILVRQVEPHSILNPVVFFRFCSSSKNSKAHFHLVRNKSSKKCR